MNIPKVTVTSTVNVPCSEKVRIGMGQPVRVTFSDGVAVEVTVNRNTAVHPNEVRIGTEWFHWTGRYTPCPQG